MEIIMKLVMTYQITDGYTFDVTYHQPFEYKSKDEAEFDILYALSTAYENNKLEFKFANETFDVEEYSYTDRDKVTHFRPPTILTLEQWFEKNKL